MNPGTRTKLCFLLILFGLVLMGIGLYIIVEDNQFVKQSVAVKGKVVDFYTFDVDGEDGGSNTLSNPIIRYAVNDSIYLYRKPEKLAHYDYTQNEEIDLLIERDHPENARINNFNERWSVAVFLMVVSMVPLGGVLLIRKFSR